MRFKLKHSNSPQQIAQLRTVRTYNDNNNDNINQNLPKKIYNFADIAQIYILSINPPATMHATQQSYIQQLDKFTGATAQNTSNASSHLSLVEGLTKQADKDLQQYHKLIETFRQELQLMKNRIENQHEEIFNTTNPMVEALNAQLEMSIMGQKEENLNFQNQLTELKKEKSILAQMITASNKRSQYLSGQVGNY